MLNLSYCFLDAAASQRWLLLLLEVCHFHIYRWLILMGEVRQQLGNTGVFPHDDYEVMGTHELRNKTLLEVGKEITVSRTAILGSAVPVFF